MLHASQCICMGLLYGTLSKQRGTNSYNAWFESIESQRLIEINVGHLMKYEFSEMSNDKPSMFANISDCCFFNCRPNLIGFCGYWDVTI